jgi:hypothetical protein
LTHLATIKRSDRAFDTGNLPLADIQVFTDRLCCEKGAAAAGSRFLTAESILTVNMVEGMA